MQMIPVNELNLGPMIKTYGYKFFKSSSLIASFVELFVFAVTPRSKSFPTPGSCDSIPQGCSLRT